MRLAERGFDSHLFPEHDSQTYDPVENIGFDSHLRHAGGDSGFDSHLSSAGSQSGFDSHLDANPFRGLY